MIRGDKMIIEMDKEMISNSISFLNRVELKGITEATAFLQIVQAVNNAKENEVDNAKQI